MSNGIYLIGIDEAGYGPNLGPLVISSSCWFLDDYDETISAEEQLRQRLEESGAIAKTLKEKKAKKGLIAIGDSKTLYQSGDSLDLLQETVLSVLALTRRHDLTWSRKEVFAQLSSDMVSTQSKTPWNCEHETEMVSIAEETVATLSETLFKSKVAAPFLFSRTVSPLEFNTEVRKWDSKATAHIHWVLELVRFTLEQVRYHATEVLHRPETPVVVLCDKLGARNRYAPFLCAFFEEGMVQTLQEGAEKSEYRFSCGGQSVEMSFHVRGERLIPIAMASLTSKWLRELAMESFNSFWCRHVPNLRSTAGYPVDAKRFLCEIKTVQKQLDIPDDILWRCR